MAAFTIIGISYLKDLNPFTNGVNPDGASLALNYYQNGMHFFSLKHTISLPIIGIAVPIVQASSYSLLCNRIVLQAFGYHDYIFRITNTFLFFLVYFTFKLYHYLLKDVIWAILLSPIIFTAPVLVYYGNNYLKQYCCPVICYCSLVLFIKYYFERIQN